MSILQNKLPFAGKMILPRRFFLQMVDLIKQMSSKKEKKNTKKHYAENIYLKIVAIALLKKL